MTRLLDWLDRRIGRFAVPHVTLALILGQVLVFFAMMTQEQNVVGRILLGREAVLAGEWWRLVTYVFVPPSGNVLFALIGWMFFHFLGSTLESTWGDFRYNAYLLIDWVLTTAVAMLVPGTIATNVFIGVSVLLAFARLYPDYTIQLYFILPIKIKWLGYLAAAGYALTLITGDWPTRAMVLASVANYLLFFGGEHVRDFKADARRKSYQAKAKPAGKLQHVCAVCGRNSADEPGVAFRYCSKCAGGACYCPDHLHDHEHVEAG
ncbi:hypothetical protein Pla123a_19970 [Posidoniimonas polymericola]|uniref:Rhomboid family protein n=1 Tax=Posidoniimonas polymericola TaxID=2528002 RepID=A0A5C5YRG9_9BACT|nr:rhomboid family intramembrane serine protease [Posidoniimonas polymericola]TWT77337.1 hypothetical protein Pla123a_19970 [Posidoniimonas polymericola]